MASIKVVVKGLAAACCGACSAILSCILMFFLLFDLLCSPLIDLQIHGGAISFDHGGYGHELHVLAFLVLASVAGVFGFLGVKLSSPPDIAARRSSVTAMTNRLATLAWIGILGAVLSVAGVVILVGYCLVKS